MVLVELLTDRIVVPDGMPVPVMLSPATSVGGAFTPEIPLMPVMVGIHSSACR